MDFKDETAEQFFENEAWHSLAHFDADALPD